MKLKRFTKLLLPLIASITTLTGCGSNKSNKAAWTILIYMCGSDLESGYANETNIDGYSWNGMGLATLDINEILSVNNKPSDVNIVIETGGANEWTKKTYGKYGDYNISSTRLQRHHVTNKNKLKLDAELSYASMGEASTLQSFLEYGLKKYPAKKTGLILWNHGGGLQGVCFDEKENDSLTAPEVITAVKGALKNTKQEGKKLEWIGYDACLMQVQDIAELNSKYFNYMVASEETEAGEGWDYNTWIDDLYRKKDTKTILKVICDGFIADNNYNSYGKYSTSDNDQTLSYLDLSKVDAYKTAWENMAGALKNIINSSNQSSFKKLVNSAKHYAGDDYSYYGLFDAKDFVNKLSSNSTFNPGKAYIDAVLEAHENLVVHSAKGGAAGNSNGLCMYWAYSNTTFSYNEYDEETTNFSNWLYLNDNYGATGWW